MTFDSKKQRKIMGQFATGVTVVTTGGTAGVHGLTANAVASLSLDPPLVLVAVDKRAATLDYLKKNQCFAVNILRVEQEAISRQFATPGPKDFSDLNVVTAVTSAPILADCLAFVDCRVVEILPGGDHEIFVGEIVAGEFHGGEPLLYFSGGYRRFGESTTTSWDETNGLKETSTNSVVDHSLDSAGRVDGARSSRGLRDSVRPRWFSDRIGSARFDRAERRIEVVAAPSRSPCGNRG